VKSLYFTCVITLRNLRGISYRWKKISTNDNMRN